MAKAKDPTYAGKKDPAAPKRPATSYMLWLKNNRASLTAKTKGGGVAEVAKLAGVEWKKVSAKEKAEWQKKASVEKARYDKEMEAFKKEKAKAKK